MKKLFAKSFVIIAVIVVMILLPIKVQAMTIVLDPGHGGKDPGASNGNLIEKDMTLKIAQYLRQYLEDYENVDVLLTHNNDEYVSLEDRADFARNNNADLLVSLHINAREKTPKQGAELYVTYRTDLPKYNADMTSLGNKVLNNISKLGIDNLGVKTRIVVNEANEDEYKYFDGSNGDYYGIIRRSMKGGYETSLGPNFSDGSGIPTILVEHAYLDNNHDKKFLDSDDKLRALAIADGEAIVSHYGLIKNEIIDVTEYLFDSKYYADFNPDLRNAYGYNKSQLYNHYKVFGMSEGRKASPVFDPKYYLNTYKDLKSAFGNNYVLAYNHYREFGAKEGRAGSEYFDGKYYLNTYQDLQKTFHKNYTKALRHFMLFGMNEGRNGSINGNIISRTPVNIKDYIFDAKAYYNLHTDLQSAIGYNPTALKFHYDTFGRKEGRQASYAFDPKYYLNTYKDLKNAFGNNYELAINHFICYGINEGRCGSKEFDAKAYLNNYEDLKNVYGTNYSKALVHFVTFGMNEGRSGK